jgi:hypothetical protein
MAYKLVQQFSGSAWVEGDGTTTAVAVNMNNAPFNVASSRTVANLTITDPLGIYTVSNTVSNTAAGVVTLTFSPPVSLATIALFNFSGYFF